MNKIIIKAKDIDINLEFEFLDNPTANKIKESLPIESEAQIWGDEIYFDTGVTAAVQKATTEVEVGDIAYWPSGRCLCIFFGRTPASTSDRPVPASEVVVVGRARVDPKVLRKVKSGSKIIVL